MTDDLERLEALARKCMKPHGYMTAEVFIAAANPATILSLIQRVREAESLRDVVSMYAREERAAIAAIPQHFLLELPDGGDVKLHEGITRFARAEYDRGRAEALNEAVCVMQVAPCEYDGHAEGHVENMTRARCVQAIRALGEKAG